MHTIKNPCKNMHVHSTRAGDKEAWFSHTYTMSSTHTLPPPQHTHTQTRGKENYGLNWKKCVSRPETMNSLSGWCSWTGHSTGRGHTSQSSPAMSLGLSLWTQEHQGTTHSPIRENTMACIAEWTQKHRVAGFHGRNNKWQKAALEKTVMHRQPVQL